MLLAASERAAPVSGSRCIVEHVLCVSAHCRCSMQGMAAAAAAALARWAAARPACPGCRCLRADAVGPPAVQPHAGIFTGVAIALHNIPEGLATFVGALSDAKVGRSAGRLLCHSAASHCSDAWMRCCRYKVAGRHLPSTHTRRSPAEHRELLQSSGHGCCRCLPGRVPACLLLVGCSEGLIPYSHQHANRPAWQVGASIAVAIAM